MNESLTELKRKGNRALAAGDFEQARIAFSTLVAEYPDASDGYRGLAKTLDRMQDHESIVRLIEPVVESVRTPSLLKSLGDAYRVLAYRGDPKAVDPAIKWYKAYLDERLDAVALFYLGELYREHKKDCAIALEYLKRSWALDPGSRSVYEAALACAKKLGREQDARELAEAWRTSGRG